MRSSPRYGESSPSAGRVRNGSVGILDVSAELRSRLSAARRVALLVSGARDDAGGRARPRDPLPPARAHPLRVGARAVLSPQVGRGGLPPGPPAHARGFRGEGAGHHQARSARSADARAAIRRLPVRRRRRDPSHPRHVRHDGPADKLRDRPRRLGRDRERACTNPLGHGSAPRRHRVHRGDLQPLHGIVGNARRSRAAPRESLSLRGGRAGHDGARRDVARPHEAVGVLLDTFLRAASRRGRPRRRASTRRPSA